ncbi:relaxase domain-containing protein (plasmid) [Streptomyces xanthophaeus]|uniref:MobF family relaxase n=1 Tax=Streptomyces xanthophaeus TaxID=67385 RepID=UPI002F918A40|nr:relaxase domain-containing protein [Streptomyces xanthophaeus]WST27632.1 relaxase domain-containing protein [Streptomyces xanthophaeus]WST66000.1 relaxase domain-containing protein [Streptomyces xanthophaeus]WST66028.1 relaxase domain-containing protein [Streptomyces xanthophaeus]
MAWVTEISADEQVDYRLRRHAGCGVVESTGAVVEPEQVLDVDSPDLAVGYRLKSDGVLVWMGSGLSEIGLAEGQVLDHEGEEAARRLMKGCHPKTGARLAGTPTSVRAHESATLTVAPLVKAIDVAAAKAGVEPQDLLEGKPYQQKKLAQQQRMVTRKGEAHRLHVGTLHKLARAAGLDLADVYGTAVVATALENKDLRVDSRVRGWDLVLDLPKSDSVLAGLMGEGQEAEYRAIVHQAKAETFRQLERWIGYGVGSEDGRPVRLATGGLVGWSVEHRSARPMGDGAPGDPHLHLHTVIANMALCEDGKLRSIGNSGRDLYRHASAADAYFKARVRSLAYEKFGVQRTQSQVTRAWEIDGVPEQLRDAFSRRSAMVTEELGEDATREEQQRLGAKTRRAKHDAGTDGMRASWRQRAEASGIDVDEMVAAAAPGGPGPDGGAALAGPGGGPRIPAPDAIAAVVFDPENGLTASNKAFTRAELLAAVANALPYGIGPEPAALERLIDDVLRVEGYAVGLPHIGSTVMSSTDRYTTQDVLDAEDVAVTQAVARFGDRSVVLIPDQAAAALSVFEVASGFALSAQQRQAVTRLLTAGNGIEAVIGVAGAGKSTLMDACRIAWDATSTTYAGACLSAVGAQGLQDASAIPSRTVASWLQQIESGTGLTGIDVLVLDEAVMTDDRSAAKLLTEAARTGTQIIAVGDPQQLQAMGIGGWFREVHRLVDGEVLTENRRQEVEAERHALEVWRTGDHQQALEMLAAGGRVHAVETADEARSEMLTAWDELRRQWPDEQDLLSKLVVLAPRNTDVDALNAGAQQIRRAAGELGDEHTYALPGGAHLTLAEGDVVRVHVNDYRSRRGEGPDVLNGYRAVITEVGDDHRVQITWRTKDRTAESGWRNESAWMKPEDIASGSLSLGYAMTVAASQGLTCDTSLMYGLGANAFATYPGITRARQANHIWLPLQAIEDQATQARLGAARSETELLERAIQSFAKYLGQSSPDGMISDELRAAPEPLRLPQQVEHVAARDGAAAALRQAEPEPAERQDKAAERTVAQAREEADANVRRVVSARAARSKSASVQRMAEAESRRDADRQAALADKLAAQAQQEAATPQTDVEVAAQESPAALSPEQTAQLAQLQLDREMREVPAATSRPYGLRTDQELAQNITYFGTRAEDYREKATKAREAHAAFRARLDREAATGTTSGQQWARDADAVLHTAVELLGTHIREAENAERAAEKAKEAREILREVEKYRNARWLALRLAGTSRKEVKELSGHHLGQAMEGDAEVQRARQASRDAKDAAWETVRSSKYAQLLGATSYPPREAHELGEKLAQMRATLPQRAQDIDAINERKAAGLHGDAVKAGEQAVYWSGHAQLAQAEQVRRQQIAGKFPQLHEQETSARLVEQQRQAATAAEQRRQQRQAEQYDPPSYSAPTQTQSGPSVSL